MVCPPLPLKDMLLMVFVWLPLTTVSTERTWKVPSWMTPTGPLAPPFWV